MSAIARHVEPEQWMDDAACTQVDPELFFPKPGAAITDAVNVCTGCPVQAQCLAYALKHGERDGVWGGVSIRAARRRCAS